MWLAQKASEKEIFLSNIIVSSQPVNFFSKVCSHDGTMVSVKQTIEKEQCFPSALSESVALRSYLR